MADESQEIGSAEASSSGASAVAAAAPPRFCPACGWPRPLPGACERCEAARAQLENTESAAAAYARKNGAVRGGLLFYFSLLGLSFGLIVTAAVVAADKDPRTEVSLDVTGSALFALVVTCFCVAHRRELGPVLARSGGWKWYAIAPAAAVATFSLASGLMWGLSHAVGIPTLNYADAYRATECGAWLPILTVAVQPAIFEELAFRGVIGAGIQRALGVRDGMIVTALMFAALHLSVVSLVHLVIIGLALGLIRQRSGSLYPGMLMHGTHNGLVLAAEYLWNGPQLPPHHP